MYLRPFEPLWGPDRFVHGPLLVLAPHPDDEVIGCGGLIAWHRRLGQPVIVAVMTDGSLGDRAASRGAEYTAERLAETRAAAAHVGGFEVVFLGHPDGRLAACAETAGEIAALLDQHRPATLAFPSPFEIHPDHRATALHTAAALRLSAVPLAHVLAFEIGAPMPSNVLLEITPVMAQKEAAVATYHSQLLHQDLVAKVRALNRARTVNVDDAAIQYVEAFTRIEPKMMDEYARRAEALIRLVDEMGAPIRPVG